MSQESGVGPMFADVAAIKHPIDELQVPARGNVIHCMQRLFSASGAYACSLQVIGKCMSQFPYTSILLNVAKPFPCSIKSSDTRKAIKCLCFIYT